MFFRGLKLDNECEPIQMEIDRLEKCADKVQLTVNKQKADVKRLKKDLARLKTDELSISADVDELTQALHDDVITALISYIVLQHLCLGFIDCESSKITMCDIILFIF